MKWKDIEEDGALTTTHHKEIFRITKGQDKGYHIYGILCGFDITVPVGENDEDDWDMFVRVEDFYASTVEYYKENPDPDIHVYEQNGKAGSNLDENYNMG